MTQSSNLESRKIAQRISVLEQKWTPHKELQESTDYVELLVLIRNIVRTLLTHLFNRINFVFFS